MASSSPLDGIPIDPEVRSFFRVIKENPDDDTPRLIFADWLQERGDAAALARGEFLRLNVLRHRLSPDGPYHDTLKRREAEIVRQHQWTWLGPLADAARWTYERGMIQLMGRAKKILTTEIAGWARTEAALWIDALTLTDLIHTLDDGVRFRRAGLQDRSNFLAGNRTEPASVCMRAGGAMGWENALAFAVSPLLEHLNWLDLSSNHLRDYFATIIGTPRLSFLTKLRLARNRLTTEHIAHLAEYPLSRRLTLLDLRHNRLNDEAARLLSESPHLRNVAELRVSGNRFTAEGRAMLRDAFGERVQLWQL